MYLEHLSARFLLDFRIQIDGLKVIFFFPESGHAKLIFKEKRCNLDFELFSKDLYSFHLS